eukprot:gene28616-63685_t
MRFLHYAIADVGLATHVDLRRTWEGRESTHTFILYLRGAERAPAADEEASGTNEEEDGAGGGHGGETVLMEHARGGEGLHCTLLRGEAW